MVAGSVTRQHKQGCRICVCLHNPSPPPDNLLYFPSKKQDYPQKELKISEYTSNAFVIK